MNQRSTSFLAGRKPVYFETITFDDTVAVGLNIDPAIKDNPETRPYYAVMVLEAATEANAVKAAHFREDPQAIATPPTALSGMPLGNGWQYELQGYDQLDKFRIIGVGAGLSHKLQVTYYKLGDQ